MRRYFASSIIPHSSLKSNTFRAFSLIFSGKDALGALPRTLPRRLFEKSPLGTRKNFRKGAGERDKASKNRLFSGLCPEPRQGGFLKKAPLEPAKTFEEGQENGIKQAKTDFFRFMPVLRRITSGLPTKALEASTHNARAAHLPAPSLSYFTKILCEFLFHLTKKLTAQLRPRNHGRSFKNLFQPAQTSWYSQKQDKVVKNHYFQRVAPSCNQAATRRRQRKSSAPSTSNLKCASLIISTTSAY